MVKNRKFKIIIIVTIIIVLYVFLFYVIIGIPKIYNPDNLDVMKKNDYLVINGEKYLPCYDDIDYISNKEKIYSSTNGLYHFVLYTSESKENFFLEDSVGDLMYLKENESINDFQIDYYKLIFPDKQFEKYIINNGKRNIYDENVVGDEVSFKEIIISISGDNSKQSHYNFNNMYCECKIYFKNNIFLELYVFKEKGKYYCFSTPFIDSEKIDMIEVREISPILFE